MRRPTSEAEKGAASTAIRTNRWAAERRERMIDSGESEEHRRREPQRKVGIAEHAVAVEFLDVLGEPVARAHAAQVGSGENLELVPGRDVLDPVRLQVLEVELHHLGVENVAEAQVGRGDQEQNHQTRRRSSRVAGQNAPVVAPVDDEQQQAGDEHHPLAVGVTVKGGGARDRGRPQPPRRNFPIQQIGEHENRVEPHHHRGLERGPRVQEPGRQRRHDESARPPQTNAEEPLERQHEGGGAEEADDGRSGPNREDGLAEDGDRQGVDPHRQAEVEDPDVAEIGRAQHAVFVVKVVGDEILREIGLVRLVAEEVDRVAGDSIKPGRGVENQHRHQGRPVAAGEVEPRDPAGGRGVGRLGGVVRVRHPPRVYRASQAAGINNMRPIMTSAALTIRRKASSPSSRWMRLPMRAPTNTAGRTINADHIRVGVMSPNMA